MTELTGAGAGGRPAHRRARDWLAHRRLRGWLARHGRHVLLAVAIGATTVTVPTLIAPGRPGHGPPPQSTPRSTAPATPQSTARSAGPVPSAGAGAPADTLLSQGRPVMASSTEQGMTPASAAVDGNPDSRWASAFSDPQWLQVDLGATATITQVVLRWNTAYATAYRIQASTDGDRWTDIYGTARSTGGTQILKVTGSGRFVRMYGTARATRWGYSLWEFEVYGRGGLTGCDTGVNAALNRPATASSVQGGVFAASNAVDGNPDSRWSSDTSDPQWIRVDLGSSQLVCQVVLAWEAAYATAFEIQVSADDAAWTSIYSTTTAVGGTQSLSVTGTGRYLRVYAKVRATGWGYSLRELTVHTAARTALAGGGT